MKIIISHDIDHLSVKEHLFKDLIIEKYIIWTIIEFVKKKISLKLMIRKFASLFKKKGWNNLKELLDFDKKNSIRPAFFIGVSNGRRLNYSLKNAAVAIKMITDEGFEAGVHGIAFKKYKDIKAEYELFKKISGLETFGIRMHYLKKNENTFKFLKEAGYLYDSTLLSEDLNQMHDICGIKEIPFHFMDTRYFDPLKSLGLNVIKKMTAELLDKFEHEKKDYICFLFHQRYFGNDFPDQKAWYEWLICYCRNKNYEFVDFKTLLKRNYR